MAKSEQIRMYGAIGYWPCDSITFGRMTKQFLSGDKLEILLNSPGGSYFDGVAIASEIKELIANGVEVSVKVMADCSSAATLILMSVPKARRSAYAGAGFLFHRPSSGAWGFSEELEFEASVLKKMEKEVASIMVEALGVDEKQIEDMLSDDGVFFTTSEMIERGYVGGIAKPSGGEDIEAAAVVNASTLSKAIMQRKVSVKTMEKDKMEQEEMEGDHKKNEVTKEELKSAYVEGMRAEMKRRNRLAEICPIGYEEELDKAYDDIEMTAETFAVKIAKMEKEARAKAKATMDSSPDVPKTEPVAGDVSEEDEDFKDKKKMAAKRWRESVFLQRSFPGEGGKEKYIEKIMGVK